MKFWSGCSPESESGFPMTTTDTPPEGWDSEVDEVRCNVCQFTVYANEVLDGVCQACAR